MSAPYRLTRQQRMLKASDYQSVFEQACKSSDSYLIVLARNNGQDVARLGLAISKKRIKLAVERNRLKRLIRESFRHNQSALSGLDCVVLARTGVAHANNQTLLLSLARHWQQIVRRCKKS